MTARTVVQGYFAAINADRFDDLATVFAPDVQIHTTGSAPVIGRPAAVAHFPTVLAAYSAHEDRVTRWVETADAVVAEIAFTGTLVDGRPVRFDALDVFDVQAGRITRVGTWFDTRDVARQVRGPS